MPKLYFSMNEYEEGYSDISRRIRLNEDAYAVFDGEEHLYEGGKEYDVITSGGEVYVREPMDENSEIDDADTESEEEYKSYWMIKLEDPDYEDITEEHTSPKFFRYRLSNIFWFVIPSWYWPLYYTCGGIGGYIAYLIEKARFIKLSKKNDLVKFIKTDRIIAVVLFTITILYLIHPIILRSSHL